MATLYIWKQNWAPLGNIPPWTCSYMSYLLDRTFTAPQRLFREANWVMGPLMLISPLLPHSCTQLLIPPDHVPTKNLPQPPLGSRTISASLQAEVEQQHHCGGFMWSALQLCCTQYMSCVWVLLKCCSTYIMTSTLLSFVVLCMFLALCGETANMMDLFF